MSKLGVRERCADRDASTQLYIDADARMDTFQAQDGSTQTRLNLVQRNVEVLSRPRNQTMEDSEKSAAEEPESGIGQS